MKAFLWIMVGVNAMSIPLNMALGQPLTAAANAGLMVMLSMLAATARNL